MPPRRQLPLFPHLQEGGEAARCSDLPKVTPANPVGPIIQGLGPGLRGFRFSPPRLGQVGGGTGGCVRAGIVSVQLSQGQWG